MTTHTHFPLDPGHYIDICAMLALLDLWLQTGPRAGALALSRLVNAGRATTHETVQGVSVEMLGIRGRPLLAPVATEALLRAWQHAARDRLAQGVRR